jgi:membrane protein implicated in regulation of membrane protease activity
LKNKLLLRLLINFTTVVAAITSMVFIWLTVSSMIGSPDKVVNGSSDWSTAIFSLFSAFCAVLFYELRKLLKKRSKKVPVYSDKLGKAA